MAPNQSKGSPFEESLLEPSRVRLFGRLFGGIVLGEDGLKALKDKSPGGTIDPGNKDLKPRFARIYGFSYEGNYYKLDIPYIYLVYDDGQEIKDQDKATMEKVGVELLDAKFLEGVRIWAYDKIVYSLRIELVGGSLEDILVDASIGAANKMTGGIDLRGVDMQQRVDLNSRVDLRGVDLTSRVDLAMRNRLKG